MTPESGLNMLSMYYAPQRSQAQELRKQYLVVFTDKASVAAIDADTRGMNQWAREDSSAAYDDVDWDNIGDRCRSKDVACSCVILGSPEGGRSTSAPFGRDGSTAEKLRKMCQASSPDGPDDAWFTLPPDSDVYLTGMPVKSTASPPPPVPAPPEIKPVLPTAASSQLAANGPTEAQIQYQQAQKAAMAVKMAQAAQAQGAQGGPFNALAQLISSGRLDPAVMTQLAGSIRSTDMNVRQKAMAQLSQLMIQAQNKGLGAAGANAIGNANANNANASANANVNGANKGASNAPPQPTANPSNAGPAANPAQNTPGVPPNATIPSMNNPSGMSQQQFVAAMQARQRAMQAHTNQQMSQQQQNQLGQIQAQQGSQQSITGQNPTANQNQNQNQPQNPQATAQTTQQLQSQQQALLLQRQQQLAAQQQQQQAQQAQSQQAQQGQQGQQGQAQNNTQPNNGPQMRAPIWSGTISWMLKGQERSIIPVQCSVLNHTMNPADLLLQQWPQSEVSLAPAS